MSGTVCGDRRHIIVPLKSRVSNCPMRTEMFAVINFITKRNSNNMAASSSERDPVEDLLWSLKLTKHCLLLTWRNNLSSDALVLKIEREIDRVLVVEEMFPWPKTCVFFFTYLFSAVASYNSQEGQLCNLVTVFCLTQPFCSLERQRFEQISLNTWSAIANKIWKHFVVSATNPSQTLPDRAADRRRSLQIK